MKKPKKKSMYEQVLTEQERNIAKTNEKIMKFLEANKDKNEDFRKIWDEEQKKKAEP